MMKLLIASILFATQLFSLTIALNSAKVDGEIYAVLHVEDEEPLKCQIIPQDLDKKIYLCSFNKIIKSPIKAKRMPLVDIDFLEKRSEFYVRIKPKVNSKLVMVQNSLYINPEVGEKSKIKSAKHWSILLYEKSPFSQERAMEIIDFPIIYTKNPKPYIGALDLNGAPISYAQSKDIRLYLDLKKNYSDKKYQKVIQDSVSVVNRYPQTIFESEFMLYRLRAMDKGIDEENEEITDIFDNNSIVDEGKAWIKAFPSDNNIPEVLMLITKAYFKMGFKSDANYFMDILVSEHEDSAFTKKAILVFADSLYNKKHKAKAIKLYMDVLYSAQDLDIATQAAIRLSNSEMDRGKTNKARAYLSKVLEANKDYLTRDRESSYKLAKKLAKNGLYDVAAQVADVLLIGLKRVNSNREVLLRDSGIWHAKANDIKEGYDRLQQYLSEYSNGRFVDEVQSSMDELFFELKETNETKLANYYDKLIDKYKNKIGDKAVVEKAKLLLSQKRYKDVLRMQAALEYVNENNATHEYVAAAATALTAEAFEKDRCTEAVNYIEIYKLDLKRLDSSKVFDCFILSSRYKSAKNLSEGFIKEGGLKSRSEWMQKYLQSLYKLHEYRSVIDVGNDVLGVSKSLKTLPKNGSLQMMFFSYMKLKHFEKAIEIAEVIEKSYPDELKNSDVYMKIVQKAQDDRDDLLLKQYAEKIMLLQKKFKSSAYTPEVELGLIEALKRLKKPKEALVVAKSLLEMDISLKQKTRAYYNAGELSMKLDKNAEAKEYFEKCKNIEVDSSWRDICEQNLKLL